MVQFKKLETTLEAGTNTHTFTDDLITDNSVIEVYTDNDDVYPVNIEQSGHSVNIEIVAHTTAVRVAITINNVISYEPVDLSGINTHLDNLDQDVNDITTSINGLTNRVLNNENDIDTINDDLSTLGTMITGLETSKQDLLIQGDNITLTPQADGVRISALGGGSGLSMFTKLVETTNNSGNWINLGDISEYKAIYIGTYVLEELRYCNYSLLYKEVIHNADNKANIVAFGNSKSYLYISNNNLYYFTTNGCEIWGCK